MTAADVDVHVPLLPGEGWSVVHDFSFVFGGAEWVTHVLSEDVLPGARTYYLAGDAAVAARLNSRSPSTKLTPRWIDEHTYRLATPAYAGVTRVMPPLQGNVLASSYGFAHFVRATGTKVVYCHSPLRQAWTGIELYTNGGPLLERLGVRLLNRSLRAADCRAAATADAYVASSRAVRDRIRRYYGLPDVPVVPPPVDDEVYTHRHLPRGDHYLFVGRITEPYKRVGLLLEAFRSMPRRRLVVIGDGRERARLQASAPANVRFLGWLEPRRVALELNTARGLLFPSEDDFGLVAVEAMTCGCPVLAYGAGGARDTVLPGISGDFFDEPTPAALAVAVERFENSDWDADEIVRYATRFGRRTFIRTMRAVLEGLPDGRRRGA